MSEAEHHEFVPVANYEGETQKLTYIEAVDAIKVASANVDLSACLTRILRDLPRSRDWLDPETERWARELTGERELPLTKMRGHRAGCFCKGNERDPRCDSNAQGYGETVSHFAPERIWISPVSLKCKHGYIYLKDEGQGDIAYIREDVALDRAISIIDQVRASHSLFRDGNSWLDYNEIIAALEAERDK